MDQETFVGLTEGPVTQKILEGVRTGAITKKTIRDALAKSFLEVIKLSLTSLICWCVFLPYSSSRVDMPSYSLADNWEKMWAKCSNEESQETTIRRAIFSASGIDDI